MKKRAAFISRSFLQSLITLSFSDFSSMLLTHKKTQNIVVLTILCVLYIKLRNLRKNACYASLFTWRVNFDFRLAALLR